MPGVVQAGRNPLHWACENLHINVAEYLLDNTRIDPLAKFDYGDRALVLAIMQDKSEYQCLPFLDLFHRKAPRALEMQGTLFGKF